TRARRCSRDAAPTPHRSAGGPGARSGALRDRSARAPVDRARSRTREHRRLNVDALPSRTEGRLMDDRPRYMISVAADLVGMHPQTLRIYEAKGLVRPKRTPGNTRLYSEADLERLRLIQRLTGELGLNLAGVEHVLRLEDQIRRMQRTMERLEREMHEAIAQVH